LQLLECGLHGLQLQRGHGREKEDKEEGGTLTHFIGDAIYNMLRRFFSTRAPRIKSYLVSAVAAGPTHAQCVTTTASGHEVRSDLPKFSGGTDSAAEPVYLLLSALAGCEAATAAYVARHMKLRIGAISFELEAERDERGALAMPIADEPSAPARLLHVRGVARVSDTEATPEQLRALGRAVHRRCPVANMIELSGCVLDVDFVHTDRTVRREDGQSDTS
jgi:uncharacterized OsmC-like protein